MKRLLAYTFVLLIAACGSADDGINAILGAEKGHFHGVSIGDKHQAVVKKIAGTSVSSEEGLISCEYEVEDVAVAVRYEFDGDVLYSIQADLFFSDTTALNNFENGLITRYNGAYGEKTEHGGFFVWQENNQVEFTLADESIEFGQPKLSLTIYNFGY